MKFVTGNGRCHKGSDYVKGRLLSDYFRDRPQIRKEQLFQWMKQMGKQLQQYHKCGSKYYYRFVNPYMFVLTENGDLMLIDPQAESNQELVQKMHQEAIRSSFLPPGEPFYKRGSRVLDIYGMGRTMQYMLAQSAAVPALTKFEEFIFRRTIQKCLNYNSTKCYSNVSQVTKNFPKVRNPTPTLRIILAITAILIGIFIVFSDRTESSAKADTAEIAAETAAEPVEGLNPVSPLLTGLYLELGYVYLAQLNMPGESQMYFAQISSHNEIARCYELIAGYMHSQKSGGGGQELEAALAELEKSFDDNADIRDYCIWLRAYALLNTTNARQAMIRIGEKAVLAAEEPVRQEIAGQLAEAYREEGEAEQALVNYERLKLWMEAEKMEPVYLKIIGLYEEMEEWQAALEECDQAIEELPYSKELKIRHIKLMCQHGGEDKQAQEQLIQQYLIRQPEIGEDAAFQKLQTEYGIQTEGDQEWTENEQ